MKKNLLLLAALATMGLSSCHRTCRCYHYNGTIVEFSEDDLDAYNTSCEGMENINYALTYSLCEWVL